MSDAGDCPGCGRPQAAGPCPSCRTGPTNRLGGDPDSTRRPPDAPAPGPHDTEDDPDSTKAPRVDGPASTDLDPFATREYSPPETIPAGHRPDPGFLAPPGYEILGMLGRGGMGVVFEAKQSGLRRRVALKMIRSEGAVRPGQLERFRIEAEAVARLRHPNVVQVYEVGEAHGLPFLSLELLEGGSLADLIAGSPQPPRRSAELLATLAGAVHAAHLAGIVHRDLKPQNVLFDRDGTPKVTDFGLAKRLEAEAHLTLTHEVMGTPAYMAPEQAVGKNRQVGPAADVYALGAILYAMLTGRPPLQGTSWHETLLMVAGQDPVPPSRLQPKVSRDLETICLKCLAKDPRKRFGSAEALAGDLGRFLAGRPIAARRTPAWERGLKWARRHPTAAGLAALGLSAAIGTSAALARREESARARRGAEAARLAAAARRAGDDLARGRILLAGGEMAEARMVLTRLLDRLSGEPGLAETRARAADALDEVRRGADERARFARFAGLRDEALFHSADARIDGVDLGCDPRKARASAFEALALFEGRGGPPASLSAKERAEVASGSDLLRVVLAEAIARPLPGEDARRQALEALRVLDSSPRPPTRASRIRRASCLARAGDPEGARRERLEADRLEPSGAIDHLLIGLDLYHSGELPPALRHFDRALLEQPGLFWAQCLKAIGLLNASPPRPGEARASLDACIQQRPDYAWLRLIRGFALGQMVALERDAARKLPGRAADLLEQAEAHFEAGEADFREALAPGLNADLRFALHVNRGVLRLQAGRPAEAVPDFEEAARLGPGRHEAASLLATGLARLGRLDEAIGQLGRAIALKPDLAGPYRDRALLRLEGGRPSAEAAEAALVDLGEAARREPPGSRSLADDRARMGRLLLGLDRLDEAVAACDAALAIAPDLAWAHRDRVAALLELGRFGQVVGSCDAALAKGPPSADLLELRGLARVAQDDFPRAIDDLTRALAIRPDWSRARVYRGRAYLLANAPELALRDFEEAVRLDPADPDGFAGRGAAKARLRLAGEAAVDVEESLRRGEPDSRRLYLAARTYAQAAAVAASEFDRRGRPAIKDAIGYESRAAALLARSLDRLPLEGRAKFWREVVEPDEALASLRRRPRLREIATRPLPPPR